MLLVGVLEGLKVATIAIILGQVHHGCSEPSALPEGKDVTLPFAPWHGGGDGALSFAPWHGSGYGSYTFAPWHGGGDKVSLFPVVGHYASKNCLVKRASSARPAKAFARQVSLGIDI
jgi:hypothetical protein